MLVNNAGIQPPASCVPIHTLPIDLWHKIIATNVNSIFYMTKNVIPIMIQQHAHRHSLNPIKASGGNIINIASVQGLQSQAVWCPHYAILH